MAPAPEGAYVAPPRNGTEVGETAGVGIEGFAIHIPATTLRMPMIQLPNLISFRRRPRMMVEQSEAAYVENIERAEFATETPPQKPEMTPAKNGNGKPEGTHYPGDQCHPRCCPAPCQMPPPCTAPPPCTGRPYAYVHPEQPPMPPPVGYGNGPETQPVIDGRSPYRESRTAPNPAVPPQFLPPAPQETSPQPIVRPAVPPQFGQPLPPVQRPQGYAEMGPANQRTETLEAQMRLLQNMVQDLVTSQQQLANQLQRMQTPTIAAAGYVEPTVAAQRAPAKLPVTAMQSPPQYRQIPTRLPETGLAGISAAEPSRLPR